MRFGVSPFTFGAASLPLTTVIGVELSPSPRLIVVVLTVFAVAFSAFKSFVVEMVKIHTSLLNFDIFVLRYKSRYYLGLLFELVHPQLRRHLYSQ